MTRAAAEGRPQDHGAARAVMQKSKKGGEGRGDFGESCADWSRLKYVTDGFGVEGKRLLSTVILFKNFIKLYSNNVNFIPT